MCHRDSEVMDGGGIDRDDASFGRRRCVMKVRMRPLFAQERAHYRSKNGKPDHKKLAASASQAALAERSCSITPSVGSAVTNRASGVSSGIFVHQSTTSRISRCMSDFRGQLGYGFGIGFSCLIGTSTRVHSESLSAIDDPIKSLIPNRRQSLSLPLWPRLWHGAFVLCDQ